MSHASRDKPLVREIVSYLPESLTIWLDEKDLPIGSEISSSLEDTITNESDLLLFFVSPESVSSPWVKKELEWALVREQDIGSIFVFPIVIDDSAWASIEPVAFRERKYLGLHDYTIESIKALSTKLEREIFNWLVTQKDGPGKLPTRLKEFSLKISVNPGNLIRKRDLLNDETVPDNEWIVVGFQTEEGKNRKKNSPRSGLPYIRVEVINNGADIELDDVALHFKELGGSSKVPEIEDGKVNPETISAISFSNSFPKSNNMHILSNHKESYGTHAKIILGQILHRGIEKIEVTDVSGNKYYPDNDKIKKAEDYLHYFFSYEGLDALYEELQK